MKKLAVIPVYNRADLIQHSITQIAKTADEETEILIIDDGSDDHTSETVETDEKVKYLKHDNSLGYGGCIMSAIDYAQHNGNEEIYFLDPTYENFHKTLPLMYKALENCDILNCSRYTDADSGQKEEYLTLDLSLEISNLVNSVTGLQLTDVFSPFKAVKTSALNEMILEEFDEAIIMQLFIQGTHFKKKISEIFSDFVRVESLNDEHHLSEDFDYYKNFINGEIILYPV